MTNGKKPFWWHFDIVILCVLLLACGWSISTSNNAQASEIRQSVPLQGTTGSIGGGALVAGACASGTATVTGATTSMVAVSSPGTYPGDGNYWVTYVSAGDTVTVKVCAAVAGTPTASTYVVRVI